MSRKKRVSHRLMLLSSAVAGSLGGAFGSPMPQAKADTYYWDVNGTTPGFGTGPVSPSPIWGSAMDWTTDPSGDAAPTNVTVTNADDVNFSSVGNSQLRINSSGGVASSITFNTNVTMSLSNVSGGSITIGGSGAKSGIFVASGDNADTSIASGLGVSLAANSTFQNAGAGLLSIAGSISGSSNLTVQANSTGGITLGAINNGGTVTVSGTGTGTVTISGVIGTNVTGVTVSSGFLTLGSTQSTYTTATTISGGTVAFTGAVASGAKSAFGNAASAIAVSGGGILSFSGTAATFGRGITIGTGGAEVDNTDVNTLTIAGAITGTANLVLNASSTGGIALSASNTFTGGVTLQQGELILGNAHALGSGTVGLYIQGGSIDTTANVTETGVLALEGDVTFIGTHTLTLNNSITDPTSTTSPAPPATRTITADAGSLTTSNINIGTDLLDLTGAGTIVIQGTSTANVLGLVTSSVTTLHLNKAGVAISASGLTITAGTATETVSDQIADTAPVTVTGGTFALGAFSDTIGSLSVTNASVTGTSAGALTIGGSSATTVSPTTGTSTISVPLTLGSGGLSINATSPATVAVSGAISGTSNVTIANAGAGTTFSATNAYSGQTIIQAGTLSLSTAGNNNIASSSKIVVGDTLAHNSAVLDVTGVTGAGGFKVASGQIITGFGTVSGSLTVGSGAIISAGNGPTGNTIGTLTTGNTTLGNGGQYSARLAVAGNHTTTSSDLLSITGTYTDPGIGNIFTIDLINPSTAVTNFSSTTAYNWLISTIPSGGKFTGDLANGELVLNTADVSSFLSANSGGSGMLNLTTDVSGDNLYVSYTPSAAPEPGTTLLLAAGLGPMFVLRRRRRTNKPELQTAKR